MSYGYNNNWQQAECNSYGGQNNSSTFVLIVVLFILLIIVGAVIWN